MTGVRHVGNDSETGAEIWAPHIIWGAEHVEVTATEAMQAEAGGNRSRTERREATTFLKERLAGGPARQKDVLADAEANDISKATLRRAKKELGVISRKGKGDADQDWTWELPSAASTYKGYAS